MDKYGSEFNRLVNEMVAEKLLEELRTPVPALSTSLDFAWWTDILNFPPLTRRQRIVGRVRGIWWDVKFRIQHVIDAALGRSGHCIHEDCY